MGPSRVRIGLARRELHLRSWCAAAGTAAPGPNRCGPPVSTCPVAPPMQDIEAMKARLAEMEKEAEKLKEMQARSLRG